MIRVLTFCDYYRPDSCGGAERVAREVATRLVRDHGAEVRVVGAVPGGQPGSTPELPAVLVPGHDLSGRIGVQLMLSRQLPRAAAEVVRSWRPDVLHAHGLHFQSSLVAAALARRYGVPLVITAHLGDGAALGRALRAATAGWDHTIGRAVVAASTGLVAVSSSVGRHLRRLGAGDRPVTVAPNGVDHDAFHPHGRAPASGQLRVGFVGRLIANKGPGLLLDGSARAIADGADLGLTFVGDGPLRPALERAAAEAGLAGRVQFTGQVRDVAQRLRGIDVLVRPSFTEGLPLAVLEAMASGAVVVASAVPGNLELITPDRTGLVVPVGNPAAIGSALGRLAGDPALLARLRSAALAAAAGYRWEASAAHHLGALQAACGQTPVSLYPERAVA